MGIAGAASVWSVTSAPTLLALSCALGVALASLACIDAISLRLPDILTLPLTAAGLAIALGWLPQYQTERLVGALAGFSVLAVLAWAYRQVRGHEGLGLGDAKLLGAAGAWLGWKALPTLTLIACAAAFGIIAVRALLQGRPSLSRPLPLGVALCLAFWVEWLRAVSGAEAS